MSDDGREMDEEFDESSDDIELVSRRAVVMEDEDDQTPKEEETFTSNDGDSATSLAQGSDNTKTTEDESKPGE